MVHNKHLSKLAGCLTVAILISACGSPNRAKQDSGDIYASFHSGEIQYRGEQDDKDIYAALRQGDRSMPVEALEQQITEIRSRYFRNDFDGVIERAESMLRQDPSRPEAYYWMARVNLDQADFDQAENMAARGLAVVSDPSLRRELERIQTQARMGAY